MATTHNAGKQYKLSSISSKPRVKVSIL